MARNLTYVRYSAAIQLLLAGLLVMFGVVNRLIVQTALSHTYYGIWVGLWVFITAVLGCLASRGYWPVNWALVWSYMGFSITAAFFCSSVIISYSIEVAFMDDTYDVISGDAFHYPISTRIAITVIVLVLAIAEFGVSIWSAVSCCTAQGCTCCQATPQGNANQGGLPAGVAVAYSGEGVQVPTSVGTMMAVPVPQTGTPVVAVQMPS